MSQGRGPYSNIQLSANNIGGINRASETIHPGVTILVGENATNRTSLLQAIAAALGTGYFTLKRDADTGKATLTIGDRTYSRTLKRENSHVETGGEPYLEDPELAELYAILLESNEIRRAIRENGDIRELIVRPLDVEQINERISEIVEERREIDRKLDEYDRLEDKLTEQKANRKRYEDRLEELDSQLEERRTALENAEKRTDSRSQSEIESRLEEKLDEIHETKSELEKVRENLDIEQCSLESLQEDKKAIEAEYASTAQPDTERLATLEERRKRLREQKQSLGSTISELQQVISFNDERLEGDDRELFDSLNSESGLLDKLNPSGEQTVCWTCGTEVSRSRIEETVESLRALLQDKITQRNEISSEIQDVADELSRIEQERERYERLESKLADIEGKIEQRKSTVQRLRDQRIELEDRLSELEREADELKGDRQSEVLELQEAVSELQFENQRVNKQLNETESEIERIQEQISDRESLEAERETLSRELQELRTRVERLETEAIEQFNTHMAELLDILDYENIERIWIEATERTVDKGQGTLTERIFELNVVRQTEDGAHYEDSIEHLSESERELVGLVVALAGYLAHEMQEKVPFMLLDSLEMVDGERLTALVSYLDEYVPYLVVVLLPDHADAFAEHDSLPDHRINKV